MLEKLEYEELLILEDSLKVYLDDSLGRILSLLNNTGKLEELLYLLQAEHLLKEESNYQTYKYGTIVVVGESSVKADQLLGVGKSLGIEKNRFELCLDYEGAAKFNYRKTQYQPTYSLIMVGPMPHSGEAKEDYGSIISAIESEEGYPPVVRLGSQGLKITKSDFKQKLEEVLKKGIISA